MDAVRAAEHPFTPGPQQVPLGIEHRNRVLAAIEGINAILPVDADRGAVAECEFLRHFRPVLLDFEGVFAFSELNRHASSSPLCSALPRDRDLTHETQIRRALC